MQEVGCFIATTSNKSPIITASNFIRVLQNKEIKQCGLGHQSVKNPSVAESEMPVVSLLALWQILSTRGAFCWQDYPDFVKGDIH